MGNSTEKCKREYIRDDAVKKDKQYQINQLSSGETELLNFLLGILSTGIRNGMIIIDEPELHLHPRWQTVLIELFSGLSESTGNQFIFTTHSRDLLQIVRLSK